MKLITNHPFFIFCLKNKIKIFFFLLFIAFLFLRFYQLLERTNLGWDQADSAWGAERIIHENLFTLQGVPIKGNASMFLGPLYYYLITPFYLLTNLDMLASPIFAGVVSVVSFFIFYHITKRLFDIKVALIALFFYTFSMGVIYADRVQAAYILIPIISYVVFYFLYKFINGSEKYILYLAAAIGFGFHIHFTTIFYLPIILLTIPFFPRTKRTLLYGLLAIAIFFLFISPMLYSVLFGNHSGTNGIATYLSSTYHGLHLKRILQLLHDAFISFQYIFQTKILQPLVFLLLPIFAGVFYFLKQKKEKRQALLLIYLIILWIVVPWIAFATYNGELTDYYFSLPRNIGFAMTAFLLMYLFTKKGILPKLVVISLLVSFSGYNLYLFNHAFRGNYLGVMETAKATIQSNKKIKFKDRDPLFYTYYIYTKYRNK